MRMSFFSDPTNALREALEDWTSNPKSKKKDRKEKNEAKKTPHKNDAGTTTPRTLMQSKGTQIPANSHPRIPPIFLTNPREKARPGIIQSHEKGVGTVGSESVDLMDSISTNIHFHNRHGQSSVISTNECDYSEAVPSEPVLFSDHTDCCGICAKDKYAVSCKLTNSFARQSKLLKRVMAFLTLELLIVIVWIFIVQAVEPLRTPILEGFEYSYIPLAVFIGSKFLLRWRVQIRRLDKSCLVLGAIIRTLCLAYYCAAVTAITNLDIILLTAIILFWTISFFAVSANFVQYDLKSSEIIGMGAVANLVFSIMTLIPYLISLDENITTYKLCLYHWLPSFLTSEFIMLVLIHDIKAIMSGWRFPLKESYWLYVALYL